MYLVKNHGCRASNSALSDGNTWTNVKGFLVQLTELVQKKTQAQMVQQVIKLINFGDGVSRGRCSTVLPAFDVYIAAAVKRLESMKPGDISLDRLKTVKPKSCGVVETRALLIEEDDVLVIDEEA